MQIIIKLEFVFFKSNPLFLFLLNKSSKQQNLKKRKRKRGEKIY
jgi:hypothetical protein